MKALAVISYLIPVALFWAIWAALTFWLGVPEWFSELVKYACIAGTAGVLVLVGIIWGWDQP